MRFQIAFEVQCSLFLFEGAVERDLSGSEFCGMKTAALVVGQEPLLEVPSEADVCLLWVIFTPENVDIEHGPCSVSLNFAGHASPDPCTFLTLRFASAASVACHA